ncbi:hypothetical protein Enr10x_04110 [Gimesia panareensis]|uniref:Methyltransferase type 11 domain-containing protein n=1 Tax=Gimesia panareensis TaxID=2527978 RepID=A0A517Q0G3_9PLAN|nr:class I SAM-dependent methyltransferase [Gimesia panareensis]QDT25117.1 hypothetical protein Enr10x_04110 [Gimesia panareensis]
MSDDSTDQTSDNVQKAADNKFEIITKYIASGTLIVLSTIFYFGSDRSVGPMIICAVMAIVGSVLLVVGPAKWLINLIAGKVVITPMKVNKSPIPLKGIPKIRVKAPPPDLEKRRSYGASKSVPKTESRLVELPDYSAIPSTDPTVPTYVINEECEIVDWNNAFALAFDNSMEGHRGTPILEWVYRLDNWKEVIDHGEALFSMPSLPPYDCEDILYTSESFGLLRVKKHAYHIPTSTEGQYDGWIVVLDVEFADETNRLLYLERCFDLVQMDLLWSDYALSYDAVLTASDTYPKLLRLMIGEDKIDDFHLKPIAAGAKVLDLGAGTGNLTEMLAKPDDGRTIVAIENNRLMFDLMRRKLKRIGDKVLRSDTSGPGVVTVREHATKLEGLDADFFDVVIANNTLYLLEDPVGLLSECARVLKPGGEIRISGPKKDTNLNQLFGRIRADLTGKNQFKHLQQHYEKVKRINERRLAPNLYRWDVSDVTSLLKEAGFDEIGPTTTRAYAGQAMIVVARTSSNNVDA